MDENKIESTEVLEEVSEAVASDEIIVDGEEVDSDPLQDSSDKVATLLSLEELIKNHVQSMDKLRVELKQAREMFDDSFNNNPTYREHSERVKEATKARTQVKQQITKQPSVAQLDQKIKDLRFDISEKNKTLSDLLQEYMTQTGATQLEVDGQTLEIVSVSRLVRKNTKFNP